MNKDLIGEGSGPRGCEGTVCQADGTPGTKPGNKTEETSVTIGRVDGDEVRERMVEEQVIDGPFGHCQVNSGQKKRQELTFSHCQVVSGQKK